MRDRWLDRVAPDWIAAPLMAAFVVAILVLADVLSAGPPPP
jgi:hypothetical protein